MGQKFDFVPMRPDLQASDTYACGWADTPARTEPVNEAGEVSRPTRARGCWAVLRTDGHGKALQTPRRCLCRAQSGRLTCVAHRRLERLARELAACAAEGA